MNDEKTICRIAVTPHVKNLMELVRRQVAVETDGEVLGINDALRIVLEAKLEENEDG